MINENLEMVMMATAIIVTLSRDSDGLPQSGSVTWSMNDSLLSKDEKNRLLEVSTMISEELQLRPCCAKLWRL